MRHTLRLPEDGTAGHLSVEYAWLFQNRWNKIRVKTRGYAQSLEPGSLEEFIAEHYWGYTFQKDGGCREYQVEHPRWRIWQTEECRLDCDVMALYGMQFASYLRPEPVSAFLAEGSPVVVRRSIRLPSVIAINQGALK